jgi:hypothetical protein
MPDRDTTGSPPDAVARPEQPPAQRYEAPQIEDLDTTDGPSVTAAAVTTQTEAAPRRL